MVRKIEKNNLSYWERRQVQNMYAYMQRAEETADQIAAVYYKSSLYLNQKMDAIFDRYKKKHGLSDGEARRLINNMKSDSIDELLSKLKSGDYSSKEEIIKELEAPAYRVRIERLQELQYELDLVMQSVYQQEKAISTEHYIKLAQESYYRSIFDMQQRTGAGFYFSKIDAKQIDKVIHSKWSGENYSSRIWNNTQKLANTVKEELLINLITGRTNREASEAIRLKFAQSSSNARRLVRTESNYIATELNSKAYEECGIKKYRYLATLDLRTSETCRELDNKIFLLKDRKIGVNCPPMHPWCRSTTVAVIDEKYIATMKRSAMDPATGKRILVPANMTYKEWHDKYVANDPKAMLEEKKIKNRTSDRRQFKRYKELLDDNIPNRLDDFQQIKYTENEKWKYIKLDYNRQKKLIDNPELKLKHSDKAILPEGKFTKYLFDGSNQNGLAKGRGITDRLGYNINNWKEFRNIIQQNATKYPVTLKTEDGFGKRYEQKQIVYGLNGKPANLIVAWNVTNMDAKMTSVYLKEVK